MKRGQTLLEGMIAAMILALGVTAIIQAILFSTIQNAGAGRYAEAAAIAGQVAAGLSRYDVRQLQETGAFLDSACVAPSSPLTDYTGGIEAVSNVADGDVRCAGGSCQTNAISATPCVVNVDDYDLTSAPAERRLVEGYDFTAKYDETGTLGYKRVAVVFDDSASSRFVHVTVVVSFLEAGQRRFVRRNVSLYQSNGFAGM